MDRPTLDPDGVDDEDYAPDFTLLMAASPSAVENLERSLSAVNFRRYKETTE